MSPRTLRRHRDFRPTALKREVCPRRDSESDRRRSADSARSPQAAASPSVGKRGPLSPSAQLCSSPIFGWRGVPYERPCYAGRTALRSTSGVATSLGGLPGGATRQTDRCAVRSGIQESIVGPTSKRATPGHPFAAPRADQGAWTSLAPDPEPQPLRGFVNLVLVDTVARPSQDLREVSVSHVGESIETPRRSESCVYSGLYEFSFRAGNVG